MHGKAIGAMVLMLCLGCGVEEEVADSQSGRQRSDALIGSQNVYWQGNPVQIPVCFESSGSQSATWKDRVRNDLQRTWQREARVNFTGWGTCVSGQAGAHVLLRLAPIGASAVNPFGRLVNGVNASANIGVRIDADGNSWHNIHEFGHVLGFWHEEERLGYQPSGDLNRNGSPDNGTADIGACAFQASNLQITSPADTYYGTFYGSYDVDSVMSYCSSRRPEGPPTSLSPNDIASVRSAYGTRVDGSLVTPLGHCLSDNQVLGESPFLWGCDEWAGNQKYAFATRYGMIQHSASGLCLARNGSAVRTAACGIGTDEWIFNNVLIRGWGGLCVDLVNGSTVNGTPIQVRACGTSVGQKWTLTRVGTLLELRFANTNKCLTVDNQVGASAYLFDCDGRATQRFSFGANGRLLSSASASRCLDVRGFWDSQWRQNSASAVGLPVNGMAVQLYDCVGVQKNQEFSLRGPVRNVASGMCLGRSSDGPGATTSLTNCTGSNVEWDYYWKSVDFTLF